MPVYGLDPDHLLFPNPEEASEDGLLAVGGCLREDWVLKAYESGIFPWFNEGDPILWWSVDPRSVLFFENLHIQKSMRPVLNSSDYTFKFDTAFTKVMTACASAPGRGSSRTWINDEMLKTYTSLYGLGVAHSAEVWREGKLVGGLYGLSLGGAFFGESMFSLERNTSKLAFIKLCGFLQSQGFDFVDCQVPTVHLRSLGASDISRKEYLRLLSTALKKETRVGKWSVQ